MTRNRWFLALCEKRSFLQKENRKNKWEYRDWVTIVPSVLCNLANNARSENRFEQIRPDLNRVGLKLIKSYYETNDDELSADENSSQIKIKNFLQQSNGLTPEARVSGKNRKKNVGWNFVSRLNRPQILSLVLRFDLKSDRFRAFKG